MGVAALENQSKPENSIANYYIDLLLRQITDSQESDKTAEAEYIAAFSQYLCKSSPAYAYNLTYLVLQHDEFCHFLRNARKKYQRFADLLGVIEATDAIQALKIKKPREYIKIRVVFNDFFEGTLAGFISFSEDFSVLGVSCRADDDIFTIYYKNQRRSGSATMDSKELAMLVDSVVNLSEEDPDR